MNIRITASELPYPITLQYRSLDDCDGLHQDIDRVITLAKNRLEIERAARKLDVHEFDVTITPKSRDILVRLASQVEPIKEGAEGYFLTHVVTKRIAVSVADLDSIYAEHLAGLERHRKAKLKAMIDAPAVPAAVLV